MFIIGHVDQRFVQSYDIAKKEGDRAGKDQGLRVKMCFKKSRVMGEIGNNT